MLKDPCYVVKQRSSQEKKPRKKERLDFAYNQRERRKRKNEKKNEVN